MSDLLVRQRITHRITRSEWRRCVEAGVFDGQRVMLRHGEIVEMTPIGPIHSSSVSRTTEALYRKIDLDHWQVRVQDPIARADDDEPQPDVVVATARADYYGLDHPSPAEIAVVIEVADTSYREDRDEAIPDYAEAGIREAWIIDVRRRHIEVFRDPDSATRTYRSIQKLTDGESIEVVGVSLQVSDLLPRTLPSR